MLVRKTGRLMIEPLAAAILNANRFTTLSAKSRSMRSNFPQNFFTPLPRRVAKGKEKATDVIANECNQCTEWSIIANDDRSCVTKHSFWGGSAQTFTFR